MHCNDTAVVDISQVFNHLDFLVTQNKSNLVITFMHFQNFDILLYPSVFLMNKKYDFWSVLDMGLDKFQFSITNQVNVKLIFII